METALTYQESGIALNIFNEIYHVTFRTTALSDHYSAYTDKETRKWANDYLRSYSLVSARNSLQFNPHFLLFVFHFCFCLEGRVTERKVSHLLVYFTNANNSKCRAR